MSIEIKQLHIENPWIRKTALPVVLSAGLLLSACGTASSEADPGSTTPAATSSPSPSTAESSPNSTGKPTSETGTSTPPTSAPKPSSTETASAPAALSIEQIEALAPAIEDHVRLPVSTRVYYNWLYYKNQFEQGDYASYLFWELYKEKDANGNLIPDEQTGIYNYNPYDPEATPAPENTCEEIRQGFLFNQALIGSINESPSAEYDPTNEKPLLTDKVNRLLAGMFLQPFDGSHAAKYYDAMVFNYTKARDVARPNPALSDIECQSTKTKGSKVTTIDVGGQKIKGVKKDIVFKLKESGTVYDASFVLVSGKVGNEAVSSWLVYSMDERK